MYYVILICLSINNSINKQYQLYRQLIFANKNFIIIY